MQRLASEPACHAVQRHLLQAVAEFAQGLAVCVVVIEARYLHHLKRFRRIVSRFDKSDVGFTARSTSL
ncbi:hypothetical protein [Burkholderia plantarii]|uniref:hypothetical protein n=1 Tax=Burkholderia plantarii TaxID=41899 RepID=UPI0018DC5F43|nr:hypothetical protein [Burkholderia plantarii]MBI0327089.1 hypothetical protein [Burkholderia plantarii]